MRNATLGEAAREMRVALSFVGLAFAGLFAAADAEAKQGNWIAPGEPDVVGVEQPAADPIPRELVSFSGPQSPGTIIINTSERRLYFVLPNDQAIRYGVGVGRPGFEWVGLKHIASKREWPDWTPPPQMLQRRPDLPRHMAGGIDNPLGARAMYLSGTLYRIHGSNEPDTIGQAVSSGCIRMTNDDVTDLYDRAKVGASVIVVQ
jgi:lipoprotein-anchoring transpeptidase ErfK/SrfK